MSEAVGSPSGSPDRMSINSESEHEIPLEDFDARILEQDDHGHSPGSIARDLDVPLETVRNTLSPWRDTQVGVDLDRIRTGLASASPDHVTLRGEVDRAQERLTNATSDGTISSHRLKVRFDELGCLHDELARHEPPPPPAPPVTQAQVESHARLVEAARLGLVAAQRADASAGDVDVGRLRREVARLQPGGDARTFGVLAQRAELAGRGGLTPAGPTVLVQAQRAFSAAASSGQADPLALAAEHHIEHPASVDRIAHAPTRATPEQLDAARWDIEEAAADAPVPREQALALGIQRAIGDDHDLEDLVGHAAVHNVDLGHMGREEAIRSLGVTDAARRAAIDEATTPDEDERYRNALGALVEQVEQSGPPHAEQLDALLRQQGVEHHAHRALLFGEAATLSVTDHGMSPADALARFQGMDEVTQGLLENEASSRTHSGGAA